MASEPDSGGRIHELDWNLVLLEQEGVDHLDKNAEEGLKDAMRILDLDSFDRVSEFRKELVDNEVLAVIREERFSKEGDEHVAGPEWDKHCGYNAHDGSKSDHVVSWEVALKKDGDPLNWRLGCDVLGDVRHNVEAVLPPWNLRQFMNHA